MLPGLTCRLHFPECIIVSGHGCHSWLCPWLWAKLQPGYKGLLTQKDCARYSFCVSFMCQCQAFVYVVVNDFVSWSQPGSKSWCCCGLCLWPWSWILYFELALSLQINVDLHLHLPPTPTWHCLYRGNAFYNFIASVKLFAGKGRWQNKRQKWCQNLSELMVYWLNTLEVQIKVQGQYSTFILLFFFWERVWSMTEVCVSVQQHLDCSSVPLQARPKGLFTAWHFSLYRCK